MHNSHTRSSMVSCARYTILHLFVCIASYIHSSPTPTADLVSYLSACARTVQEHETYSIAQALRKLDPEQSSDDMHQWFKRYTKGPVGKQHGTYGAFVKFVALWKHSTTFNYQDTASLSDQYIEGMLELLAQADSDFFYSPFLADFATTILQTWKPSPSDERLGAIALHEKAITQARKLARLYLEQMKDYLYTSPAYVHASYDQEAVHICKTDTLDKVKYSELGYVVGGTNDFVWIKHITTGREVRIPLETSCYALSFDYNSLCDNGRYLMLYSRDNTFLVIYDLKTFTHTKVLLPQELDHRLDRQYVIHPSHPLIVFVHRNQRIVTLYMYDIEKQSWTHLNTLQNCDYCVARWLPDERLLLSHECLLDSTLNIQTASHKLHIYGADFRVYTGFESVDFLGYNSKSKILLYRITREQSDSVAFHDYDNILGLHDCKPPRNTVCAVHIPSRTNILFADSNEDIIDAHVTQDGLYVIQRNLNGSVDLHDLEHKKFNISLPKLKHRLFQEFVTVNQKLYIIARKGKHGLGKWSVYCINDTKLDTVSSQKLQPSEGIYQNPRLLYDMVSWIANPSGYYIYSFNKTSKTITEQRLSTFKPSSNSWISSLPKSPYIIFKKNENQSTILERNKSFLESLSDDRTY